MQAAPRAAGEAPSTSPSTSPFAAFAYNDYRYYAAARFLATVGIQMQFVAVGFQVYALTHRPLDLGYVGLAQFLPVVGLSLPAGHVADRFDRRRILLVCDLCFAAGALALFGLSRSPRPSLPWIFATLVALGAERAFYGPAASSFVPQLVPRAHLANAITWQSTLWQLAAIGGPSVGGLLYALGGSPGPVYLATAVVLVVAGACILRVRTRPAPGEREAITSATVLAGVRYVAATKVLLGSISLDFFAVFLGGAVAMLPVYATEVLHVGAGGLGLLRAAPAVGAGLMAAFLSFRPMRRRAGARMLAGTGVFGAATVVFGLSQSFALSLFALAVLGAADMVSVVVRMTLEQVATPPAMRGRVSAVNMVFVGASNELGEFESGTAAALLGVVPSVVLGGLGAMVVVALWAWRFPELRRVDRLEDVAPT